ncbi:MAG TPA: YjbQ family protein [Armatimonadetes bacterium]|nr:YjbQ family protein [Armatimonadota bacterium]
MLKVLNVETKRRTELVDITSEVERAVSESGVKEGIVVIFVPHTTAAVTVNENYDPSVATDINEWLSKAVPYNAPYSHTEGNADAHIKSAIVGPSEALIIEGGRVKLGTWQGIFLCEFDGPRRRQVWLKIVGDLQSQEGEEEGQKGGPCEG